MAKRIFFVKKERDIFSFYRFPFCCHSFLPLSLLQFIIFRFRFFQLPNYRAPKIRVAAGPDPENLVAQLNILYLAAMQKVRR